MELDKFKTMMNVRERDDILSEIPEGWQGVKTKLVSMKRLGNLSYLISGI